MNVGCHSFKLTFRKEDCIVKSREPECRRAVEKRWVFKRGVCFGAGDLKTSYNFAERRFKTLMNPDDAVDMLRHYYALARLDFREERADVSPDFGDSFAKPRGNHFTVDDFTENRAALFNRQRNHINPRSAIIPSREANSRFKMTVFIAAVNHRSIIAKKGESAQGGEENGAEAAPGRTQRRGCVWQDQPGETSLAGPGFGQAHSVR